MLNLLGNPNDPSLENPSFYDVLIGEKQSLQNDDGIYSV